MSEEPLDPASLEFARQVGERLEQSARELPARVRSRLTRARYAALEQCGASPGRGRDAWRRWLPAAAAAVVLAVLMIEGPRVRPELAQAGASGGEDFEMLADSGAFALAQDQLSQGADVDDYEFYDW